MAKLSRRARWFALFLLAGPGLFAEVKLNGIFAENMVLQRDMDCPVYGTADDGEKVTVAFSGQTVETVAKEGKWKVKLKAMKAGGPFAMTVTGKNTIVVKNILLGDVWLLTGQSNMDTTLGGYLKFKEFYEGIPGDYSNDHIRLYKVKVDGADTPQTEVVPNAQWGAAWRVCEPTSSLSISATGYFFGRKLQPEVGVPLGLIHVCLGGTSAESWTPPEILRSRPEFADILAGYQAAVSNYPRAKEAYDKALADWNEKRKAGEKVGNAPQPPMGPNHVKRPSALYLSMIGPLTPLAIKGAIWYQGEGNSGKPIQYRTLFPAMISSWRKIWGLGDAATGVGRDFPFLFVQLASYMKTNADPEDPNWAYLREAQAMTLSLPNTGMAVAIESGMQDDIHPAYKKNVGDRLALAALKVAYGKDIVHSGPTFKKARFEGRKAVVDFDNVGAGLVARELDLDLGKIHLDGSVLRGFAVCGADQKFRWAKAEIAGNTVVCESPDVEKPVAVRYAWANFPLCNLFNKDGLPAGPFRSDDFEPGAANKVKGVTVGKPWISTTSNSGQWAMGNWAGLTDGSIEDNSRAVWSSGSDMKFPKWVTIDLQGAFDLSAIRVYNSATGGTKTVVVQVSTDGENFKEVGQTAFENYTAGLYELKDLKLGKVTHLRAYFPDIHETSIGKGKSGFVFLRELQADGVPSK